MKYGKEIDDSLIVRWQVASDQWFGKNTRWNTGKGELQESMDSYTGRLDILVSDVMLKTAVTTIQLNNLN